MPKTSEPRGAQAPQQHDESVITSRREFDKVTSSPHELAGLYAHFQLDVLNELAYAVSLDFFRRPQLYTAFSDGATAARIGAMRARYGCDEEHLSLEQRMPLYQALFEDGKGQFAKRRDALLAAAAAFAERVYDTGEDILRTRVRFAHRLFKEYLLGLQGAAVTWAHSEALPPLADTCHRILRDRGVAAVFGLSVPPGEEWPYREDTNGDKLVEELSAKLSVPDGTALTRQGFSARQQVALQGALALAEVLDHRADDLSGPGLDRLITRCYTWRTALFDAYGASAPAGAPNSAAEEANRRLLAGLSSVVS